MVDRHLLGDIGLAVLLAVPAAALVQPAPSVPNDKAGSVTVAVNATERSPVEGRFSLLG
jgi:hypothetical protein